MIGVFFKNVFIRLLTQDSVEIKWELEPSNEDMNTIGFEVQVSESQESGFRQLSPTLIDIYAYRDEFDAGSTSKWQIRFYRIKAFLLTDPSNHVVSPVEHIHENPFDDTHSPFVDPVLDIVRRNNLLLRHDRYRVGKPCIIYQKRTFGNRCKCFDIITQRVTDSRCKVCLGTGRVEGYHSGVDDIHVAFTSLAKQRQIQQWGDMEPGDTQAWMSNFPLVKPEDILVNKFTGEHWLVKRIRTSVHLIVSKQTLLVRKLNFDDIKKRLPFEVKTFRM